MRTVLQESNKVSEIRTKSGSLPPSRVSFGGPAPSTAAPPSCMDQLETGWNTEQKGREFLRIPHDAQTAMDPAPETAANFSKKPQETTTCTHREMSGVPQA